MKQTETFFADCIEVWGYEGAKAIGETVVSALWTSLSQLSLPQGVPDFGFGVYEPEARVVAGLNSSDGIRIGVSRAESLHQVVDWLPNTIIHELAHEAHSQNRPDKYQNWATIVGGIIEEGIASTVTHDLGRSTDRLVYTQGVLNNIQTTLVELVVGSAPEWGEGCDRSAYYDYLMGDESFPDRGYITGEYIVRHYMYRNRLSIQEVMQTPFNVFKEFVEEKL